MIVSIAVLLTKVPSFLRGSAPASRVHHPGANISQGRPNQGCVALAADRQLMHQGRVVVSFLLDFAEQVDQVLGDLAVILSGLFRALAGAASKERPALATVARVFHSVPQDTVAGYPRVASGVRRRASSARR